ncbi:MAG: chromosomal replication initiator protein DnaA [Planctomycetota bacterium]
MDLLYSSEFLGIRRNSALIRLDGPTNGLDLDALSQKLGKALTLVTGKQTSCRFKREGSGARMRLPYPPRLNDNMTFDSFVVGPSNRLAHAAVLACSEMRAQQFNPVVLTGEEGSGKTHLLQSLCHRLLGRKRVCYLTAKQFINVVSEASSEDAMDDLRAEYSMVDVLLFDDVHLLSNADGSREEFFNFLNTMLSSNRLVVAASEYPIAALESFEDRLLSRLSWGISFALERPNYETRLGILARLLSKYDLKLDEEIVKFLGSRYYNSRLMEDAVNRLKLIANASMCELTVKHARELLGAEESTPPKPSIDLIQSIVAEEYRISLSDINGKTRKKMVAWPRQIAMYLAREMTGYTLDEIGGLFGGRDHSTVLHAVSKVTEAMASDVAARNAVRELRRKINDEFFKSGRSSS